jgi:hypothetical protein
MANQDVKRRDFLKKGIGLASVSLIPFELDSMSVKNISKSDQKLENILRKYGAEFGHVKPELGRKNHGHI